MSECLNQIQAPNRERCEVVVFFHVLSFADLFDDQHQLIGLRETLQENPMIFMRKSGWFPVFFPLNQPIDNSMSSETVLVEHVCEVFLAWEVEARVFIRAWG